MGMAKKYINKDALMTKIDAWEESAQNGTNPNCKNGNEYEAAMDIVIMVEEAPAADVRQNVEGRWVYLRSRGWRYCSVCKKEPEPPVFQSRNFCPNCGAKMR